MTPTPSQISELNDLRLDLSKIFGERIYDTLEYYHIHNREHYKPFYRRGKIGRIFNLVRRNMR